MAHRVWLKLITGLIVTVALLGFSVASVAAAPEASVAQQDGAIHIVQVGETLSSIASRYGVSMAALAQANGITNPNFIFSGQRLVIPGASSGASGGYGSSASGGVHVVARGESLAGIAARYGVTVAAMAQVNGLSDPNFIYAGQQLAIPGASGYVAAAPQPVAPAAPAAVNTSGRWISVSLSTQTLVAYENGVAVFSTYISSGLPNTPTPVGTFTINTKLTSQRMTGPGYDLPNVPWIMYFTNRGHAIHGTYWHTNFGAPMSHGCINASQADAQWLYNFASVGTPVVIQY